ncbi:PREDICTED: succinate--CoA ligase [GDP-forming] subunit beta, mitochondrial-like [Branchiostoma belcheri]|uniref:Succinate--CoA ligase [GDP-forming] subunit beta, mitochondrial n=1 Tax=Branchiostoma belcheri TaxID=7741 RepID=A0A6P4XVE6_BRABE|nr:PREDICTED: succinate--CoA ligase [GDP-forming] subunit beta, mitochondrial-like [Branchiostoma belcheri]
MAALVKSISRVGGFASLLQKQCAAVTVPVRCLNLQEYQSKKLLDDYKVAVQRFGVADTTDQAVQVAKQLAPVREYVIKAQILAGGRGKGTFSNGVKGGVKFTTVPDEVGSLVKDMLGFKLVTKQTPPGGVLVQKVMVAESVDISRETYFAILMDRETNGPVIIASTEGGMDIEEVAEKTPDRIYKQPVDIHEGLSAAVARQLAQNLKFEGEKLDQATLQIMNMYQLFLSVDATQVEINPFAETSDGRVICVDAKINFDDNAEFRQKEIFALDDCSETDPREVQAHKHNLNYIGMDGNIGCLVNGAGLAMATMDIVKLHGGEPANFLDCGGGVTEGQVFEAFKILTSDPQVKAVLVNIFGGIVNCATIANGITAAARGIDLKIPLIVRLEGTNVDEAKRILKESGLPIIPADGMGEAAKAAVESIQ